MSNGDTPPPQQQRVYVIPDPLYRAALEEWGPSAQMNQLIEEMAELTVAISHLKRKETLGNYGAVIEEMADVHIMLEQIAYILSLDHPNIEMELESQVEEKRRRLEQRIKEAR